MSSFNLAVLVSGSGSNLQAIINAINDDIITNVKIAAVISDREGAYALERAENHGIPSMVISGRDTVGLLDALTAHTVNGIILAGYLSILPQEIVNVYPGRIINIHPALLPLFGGKGYYGIKVHQAVLASGIPFSGATVHIVDAGIDTGAALVRGVTVVLPDDTAEGLQKRVLEIEHYILVQAVKALAEGQTGELTINPMLYINNDDKNGFIKYAKESTQLSDIINSSVHAEMGDI